MILLYYNLGCTGALTSPRFTRRVRSFTFVQVVVNSFSCFQGHIFLYWLVKGKGGTVVLEGAAAVTFAEHVPL